MKIMSNKTEMKQINQRNLRILRDCIIAARKPYDIAYYSGKIDALEHIQMLLEEKPTNV
jgi:hypothetical protein